MELLGIPTEINEQKNIKNVAPAKYEEFIIERNQRSPPENYWEYLRPFHSNNEAHMRLINKKEVNKL